MYGKFSGMTGTADTEAEEFHKIYKLEVVVIPTNVPVLRFDADDVIYKSEKGKLRAIIEELRDCQERGQPVLVGTVSVEKTEVISKLLKGAKISHEVLNAKNHHREALIVAQAGRPGAITISTTNMAGRGTDIHLGGNAEYLALEAADPMAQPEKYVEVLEASRKKCAADKQRVLEAGGLQGKHMPLFTLRSRPEKNPCSNLRLLSAAPLRLNTYCWPETPFPGIKALEQSWLLPLQK